MKLRTSIAAATLLLWPGTFAFAIDVGVGGGGATADVGGIGVGVGVGGGGVSAGVDTGMSSGPSDAAGSGASAGTSSSSSTASSTSVGARNASTAAAALSLPKKLLPEGGEPPALQQDNPLTMTSARSARNTGNDAIRACRDTVAQAAEPHGLVDLNVVSNGPARRLEDGGSLTPIFTQIVYQRQGGYEMRQAPIWCRISQDGAVSGLSDSAS